MRRQNSPTYIVGIVLFLASCSTPRYTYNFDYYDYNSGRKELPITHTNESLLNNNAEPLKLDKNELVAVTDLDERKPLQQYTAGDIHASVTTHKDLSKTEKKELRNQLKEYVKNHSKKTKSRDEVASVNATKQLDDDLKLAIIFGAIGITFAILGGINTVFWVIGVVGLIVGLVFFIRWISTQ
ncbi:MAG TPA: hypothetical protein VK589_14590 [Chryseolinea sp.]|nr:hypothetical protein [Chryseolinea sp.]